MLTEPPENRVGQETEEKFSDNMTEAAFMAVAGSLLFVLMQYYQALCASEWGLEPSALAALGAARPSGGSACSISRLARGVSEVIS